MSQYCLSKLLSSLGESFKGEKQQVPGPSCDFLGLVHDVGRAFTEDVVEFFPRPALVGKTLATVSIALAYDRLVPTTAGELLGTRALLECGCLCKLRHKKKRT